MHRAYTVCRYVCVDLVILQNLGYKSATWFSLYSEPATNALATSHRPKLHLLSLQIGTIRTIKWFILFWVPVQLRSTS